MKYTVWAGMNAADKVEYETTPEAFAAWLRDAPAYPDKLSQPLISLSTYGNVRTDNGALRSMANLRECWGAELDYDGSDMPMVEGVRRFEAAGIRAAFVSTATEGRWRAFVPFDRAVTPAERNEVVERCNGVLGGVLARESFTPTQSWFVGRVEGRRYDVAVVPGAAPFGRNDLPRAGWKGAEGPDGRPFVSSETLWEEIASGQELHAAIVALAWRGVSEEDLRDAVERAAPRWTRPDAEARLRSVLAGDIPRACKSAAKRQAERDAERAARLEAMLARMTPPPPPKPRRSLLASAGEMVARNCKPDFLIDGVLEAGGLGMVFGDPGAGKSFVTLGWAFAVATGGEWNGRKPKQGCVVYVAGEGHAGISRRLQALAIHTGKDAADAPLYFTTRAVPFADAGAIADLQQDIDALPAPPVLIVVDTLNRAASGLDLDKGRDMGMFVRACDALRDRYGAAVLVVHHSGHGDKNRAMNSIAMKGAVDFEAGVKREGDDTVRLVNTKAKDSEPFADNLLRFEEVQLPPTGPAHAPEPQGSSVVLVECEAPTPGKAKRPSKRTELLIEVIRNAGGTIDAKEARDVFVRSSESKPDTARRAFYETCDRAIEVGIVSRDDVTGALSFAFT